VRYRGGNTRLVCSARKLRCSTSPTQRSVWSSQAGLDDVKAAKELEQLEYPQLWEKYAEYLEIQRQRQELMESYGEAYPAEIAWFQVQKCCGFFTWDAGLPSGPALLKCAAHPSSPSWRLLCSSAGIWKRTVDSTLCAAIR
jgi:hypothetical protein